MGVTFLRLDPKRVVVNKMFIQLCFVLNHCIAFREIKEGLYRIWCCVNILGDSGVNTLGDTSDFVNPTLHLLLTRRGKIRMDTVGIVLQFYVAPL